MPFLKITANAVILTGVLLLTRVLYFAASGQLAEPLFSHCQDSWMIQLYALILSLPVPIHVMSVGLIIRRKWLSPVWVKTAWYAVVISGFWLGAALGIKLIVL